jgi:hypothetical protein
MSWRGPRNLGLQGTAARAKAVGEGGISMGYAGGKVAGGHRYHIPRVLRGSPPLGAHAVARSSALIRRDQPLSPTWLSLSADIFMFLIVFTLKFISSYSLSANDHLLVRLFPFFCNTCALNF